MVFDLSGEKSVGMVIFGAAISKLSRNLETFIKVK